MIFRPRPGSKRSPMCFWSQYVSKGRWLREQCFTLGILKNRQKFLIFLKNEWYPYFIDLISTNRIFVRNYLFSCQRTYISTGVIQKINVYDIKNMTKHFSIKNETKLVLVYKYYVFLAFKLNLIKFYLKHVLHLLFHVSTTK